MTECKAGPKLVPARPLDMGGASSRELEAAQTQLKRLTGDLKRANTELNSSRTRLSHAEKEATRFTAVEKDLERVRLELDSAQQQSQIAHEIPGLKKEVRAARDELMRTRAADQGQKAKFNTLETELEGSRRELARSQKELERVLSQLKLAQEEERSVLRLQEELSVAKAEVVAQQDKAAMMSAQLVADASATMIQRTGKLDQPEHPVFGKLLQDFGYKKLYESSPMALWAGTHVWERQRAFRQDRASLIASAKTRSGVCVPSPSNICICP